MSHSLAKELLEKNNSYITVTVGEKEYSIKGIKNLKTSANFDDSVMRKTILCEECGCIVR